MRLILFSLLFFVASITYGQQLPARWDELTASDWKAALEKSNKTCILPIGILEKHGPHLPLGNDLIHVREWAAHATKQEYAVTFPDYFYGQINEARQQPGTFALPSQLTLSLLEATCDEIARNGFNKIVILNGHGGNPELIQYFMQSLLNKRHNYVVYFYQPRENDQEYRKKYLQMHKSDPNNDQHAGERETSTTLYYRPDLVKLDRATAESGADQKRLSLPDLYTPIWWYASFPNHYSGEGGKATPEFGKLVAEHEIELFVKALKTVKSDTKALELQNEFYDRVDNLNK
jgi:creatinine amidohydrolase